MPKVTDSDVGNPPHDLVNRGAELERLDAWWSGPGVDMGTVWRREGGELRSRVYEADAVAVEESGRALALGSCKWPEAGNEGHAHSAAELDKLEQVTRELGSGGAPLYFWSVAEARQEPIRRLSAGAPMGAPDLVERSRRERLTRRWPSLRERGYAESSVAVIAKRAGVSTASRSPSRRRWSPGSAGA